jgi:hypothetical protein
MKNLIIVLFLFAPIYITAQDIIEKKTESNNFMVGNWQIDLRPTPESEAYFQSFIVETSDDKTFSGTFYGSDIKNALINNNWSKTYFAFSTSDQSNQYYHSGYIENNQLFGITYCPNRNFIMPWTGVKE